VPLSSALPLSLNVSPTSNITARTIGISNPGWWGISVKPQRYTGSFWALGSYKGRFTVKLQSALTSQIFASQVIDYSCSNAKWTEHKFLLEPRLTAPNVNNTFVIEFESGRGSVNFNLISLFPPTYKGTPNGMRPDLMTALKGLNPTFLRMPGGNNVYVTPPCVEDEKLMKVEKEMHTTIHGFGTKLSAHWSRDLVVQVHGHIRILMGLGWLNISMFVNLPLFISMQLTIL